MSEESKEHTCSLCDKVFSYRSGLSRHIKTKHPEEGNSGATICCNNCSARYNTKLEN